MMAGSLYRGSSKGVLDGLVEKPFNGAGKGGSTHGFADTWFIGYNKRVTCGVWTGFLMGNGEPIYPGAFSRDLAMPVWQAAMNAAAPSFGGDSLSLPANVVEVPVCSVVRATGDPVLPGARRGHRLRDHPLALDRGDGVFPQGHREPAVLQHPFRCARVKEFPRTSRILQSARARRRAGPPEGAGAHR